MKNALRFLPLALLALFALASGCSESSDGESESCSDFEAEALGDASVCENSFVKTSCLGDGAAESYPNLAKACGDAAKDGDGDNEDDDPAPTTCTGDEIRNVYCGLNSRGFQKQICVEGVFINHPLEPCGDPDVCVDGTEEDDSCEFGGETGIKTRTCEDGQWSDFTECHICNEGEIDSVSYSGNLINAFRVCHSANGYGEYMFDDYNNAVNSKLYYKESGDFLGETFTTTNHVEEFSVSFWMRFDEGTNPPIEIFVLGSGGIHGNHLNLHAGSVICALDYCYDSGFGYSFGSDVFGRVRTPNVDNHIVVTMSQYYFRYYLNGEEITTITRGLDPIPHQDPENGFEGFDSPGLPAGTEFELRNDTFLHHCTSGQNVCDYNYSHTTIIDGILSPADVALLYAKGPTSP